MLHGDRIDRLEQRQQRQAEENAQLRTTQQRQEQEIARLKTQLAGFAEVTGNILRGLNTTAELEQRFGIPAGTAATPEPHRDLQHLYATGKISGQ